MLLLTAFLLRQNNLHMITLRNQVKQADEQNKDIPQALTNLRDYITTHMNTGMGDRGIYLEASYQRAYDQAVQTAAQSGSDSSALYKQVDKECQALFSRTASFPAYVQCTVDKVAASGSAQDPVAAIKPPSSDLFRYNFVSPSWSPDIAGLSLLVTMLLGVIVVGATLFRMAVYMLLRRRHQVS
jgi:hypothetical protein